MEDKPVTNKEYFDGLRKADRDYLDAEIKAIREAVNIYRITNDEWKLLHNGLQRKMDEQAGKFITWGALWAVVIGLAGFILGVAMYLKK